ncbi:hypothetical protein D3C81_725870 [compost metagenome]
MPIVVGTEALGDHHAVPGEPIRAAWRNTLAQGQFHELGQVQETDIVLDEKR